jgi:predicted amidohydrolase
VGVVLGTERITEQGRMITALVINRDGTPAGFQDKVQLDPTEGDMFVPGTGRRVFQCGALTFGISICHEGFRYPETVRWAAVQGAQLVFHPHYSWAEAGAYRPATFGDPANTFHEKAILCRAAENTCYVASVNCAGEGSPTTSAVARPDGSVMCWQPYGQAGLLIADLDVAQATGLLASRLRT